MEVLDSCPRLAWLNSKHRDQSLLCNLPSLLHRLESRQMILTVTLVAASSWLVLLDNTQFEDQFLVSLEKKKAA